MSIETEGQATARPWHEDNRWKHCIVGYEKPDSRAWIARVCEYRYLSVVDKQYLLTAVNQHDARVAVCEAARELLSRTEFADGQGICLTQDAETLEAALAALDSNTHTEHPSPVQELILAAKGALPWLCLLGDYIGNGVTTDKFNHGTPLGPMGRCEAIGALRNALERIEKS